ncbi:MAG TPA: D-2-hydroxyacid dehydrogenase [Candidatus Udaeobacter sp.]|nr:D-2-hydroxyacid dehydrogenase [Candidatus Udaeobacter sp.]
MLPPKESLTICFAHVAYRLQERFLARQTGIASFEVRSAEDLARRIGEADVLAVSGLWRSALLESAHRLRFIQSVSAGIDQFDRPLLAARGIRLASAQGVNERAVAEHAMALILALMRRLPEARDNQARRHWRGMARRLEGREDELGGKTLLIIGLGRIGGRLARLAKAFDLRVLGIRRDPAAGGNGADAVHGPDRLGELLAAADFVALTCPLTPETRGIIDAGALRRMKPTAYLVNVARGRCVEEAALVEALTQGRIAGAALDCFAEEPLPPSSPLWAFGNVLITPHSAGETKRYEDNVLDVLEQNLERLWSGASQLVNEILAA